MPKRTESDEYYVLDLADEILDTLASRQHRFEWLRGDFSEKRGTFSHLPVDGFYANHKLVIEYAERQHNEAARLFDQRATVSGVSRGEQRRIYDQRRVELVPTNGLSLVVIPATAFVLKRKKIVRDWERDLGVVRAALNHAGILNWTQRACMSLLGGEETIRRLRPVRNSRVRAR